MSKKQAIQQLLSKKPSPLAVNANLQENINTGIQENTLPLNLNENIQRNVNTEIQVKKTKATFELDSELHKRLKILAASKEKKMVEIVEEALLMYMSQA